MGLDMRREGVEGNFSVLMSLYVCIVRFNGKVGLEVLYFIVEIMIHLNLDIIWLIDGLYGGGVIPKKLNLSKVLLDCLEKDNSIMTPYNSALVDDAGRPYTNALSKYTSSKSLKTLMDADIGPPSIEPS